MTRSPAAAPVFLIGAARSGTSLLYKCLCLHPETAWISNWQRRLPGHPGVGVLNRLARRVPDRRRAVWFSGGGNAYVYGGGRRRVTDRLFPMPVEGEPLFAHCGVPAPAQRSPEPDDATLEAMRALVAAIIRSSGGLVFVNKRIGHNWRIPLLREAFPQARFVELVRDGRAVAYSLSRVDWWDDSDLPWLGGGTPREWRDAGLNAWDLCAMNWVAELDAIAEGLRAVPEEQRMRIRYEDFVAAPVEALEQVAHFAGLSPDTSWRHEITALHYPDRNESWRSKLDPHLVRRIEADQAEKLREHGYALA